MSRTHRSFPRAFRVLATACAVLALAWFVPAAGAAPPTPDEVDQAEARAEQLEDAVAAINTELDTIEQRLAGQTAEIDRQEGILDQTKADLVDLQTRMHENQARYDRIVVRLNRRATEAYMQGPGSSVDFLLGATSLADLSDRIEYVDAVAQSDADLAQEVENLHNLLVVDEAHLQDLKARQAEQLAEAEAQAASIRADLDRQEELLAARANAFAEARETFKLLEDRRERFEKLQAERAAQEGYSHASVPLPDEWRNVLQFCPVGSPRYFGDGFGADRFAGGYHLHKGVDILAASGTEIYAPFDGYASTSYNSLGGDVVFVDGAFGRVYNAHLSAFSELSNGPVSAGDVIGYVGDTGDAIGTPHDHFEFHPKVMPANWPVSSYGYSIIEDAINPYPLLVEACG
jgi:murein DD-endopeptidase MepM/ murein hydrolase activator NlpD